MPTCQELTELVTDYLEGSMPAEDREVFLAHVEACQVCHYYLRQMEVTVQTLGRVPREPMPPQVKEAFMEAFKNWKKNRDA